MSCAFGAFLVRGFWIAGHYLDPFLLGFHIFVVAAFLASFVAPLRSAADPPATAPGTGTGAVRNDDRVLRDDPLQASSSSASPRATGSC